MSFGTNGFVIDNGASKLGLECVSVKHGRVIVYAPRKLGSHKGKYPTMIWI